ncbi:MAG: S1 RNA-binding domain-containing protein [Chloroflexi bacterium]|nr:S1 RNA-binding domain-containing protein [Chloroflexota bacterium]
MTTPEEIITTPGSELKPKTKLSGKVVKTTLAGVLVDLGMEIPGIIHISQLSATAVKRVEDVVQVGQTVDVWVRKVKADRVELTMIEPVGMDWRELKPELIVKGKVVRLETYGAFVEIGAERPGLVHISEMAHGYVKAPGDVVKEGDEIDVMVLDVDRKKKQIRLSMKAVLPKPEEKEEVEPAPRMDRAERTDRKRVGAVRKGKPRTEKFEMPNEPPSEPEPTVFELAWQAALDRAKAEKAAKSKKAKAGDHQQDDILDRTLKNRLPTA